MLSRLRKKMQASTKIKGSRSPHEDIRTASEPLSTASREPNKSIGSKIVYQALSGHDAFRLVKLDPATDYSHTISCEVYHASLTSVPEYEAVSYVWGLPTAREPILLRHPGSQGVEFAVGLNLEAALRALRRPDKPRVLWIDSICIDQGSHVERASQVKLMGRIYQNCTRDLLWLGSETESIQKGMDTIQSLANVDECKLSGIDQQEWNNLEASIVDNPVWTRAWIVQELFFAPKILLCRDDSLEWDDIVTVLEDNEEIKAVWTSQEKGTVFDNVMKCFGNIVTFHTIRHKAVGTRDIFSKDLLSIVVTFGKWHATLPVDKIYGLLNVAEDAEDLPVDYTRSLAEVSLDFAEHTIMTGKSLLILSAAIGDPLTHTRTENKERDLPT